jgi:hypothetical protein
MLSDVSVHCNHLLLQLEYLDATVLRCGVGEIWVVVGRDPAC